VFIEADDVRRHEACPVIECSFIKVCALMWRDLVFLPTVQARFDDDLCSEVVSEIWREYGPDRAKAIKSNSTFRENSWSKVKVMLREVTEDLRNARAIVYAHIGEAVIVVLRDSSRKALHREDHVPAQPGADQDQF